MHEPTSGDRSASFNRPAVDIIVPVYRGMADTCRCLESVLASRNETDWRLIVINDCSPEPALASWLLAFAQRDSRVELMENVLNLGFVGTVNRGMRVSTTHDVVLLNSDAEVASDWLDRLQSAAYRTPRVGTVTPFSNNATICSYPNFCQANELPDGYDTAELDALFAYQLAGESVDVPTAVGFCMYVQRECLDEVGLFDEENFGKGYGEENDFCWRARQAGWVHRHALDTFVRHAGGVSFGDSAVQRQLIAMQTMRRLHPDYEEEVQAFVHLDPARSARQRIDMARAYVSQMAPNGMGCAVSCEPVFHVVPANGGGVDRYVRDLCAARPQDCIVHVAQTQFVFEVAAQGRFIPFDMGLLNDPRMTAALGRPACLHVHSTLEATRRVCAALSSSLGVGYVLTLHDTDFVGDALECDEAERAARHAFVRGARSRIVPSRFIGRLLSEVLSDQVTWHLVENGVSPDVGSDSQCEPPAAIESFQVAVVGALGPGKGLDFLKDVAQALEPGIRIVIFGYVDGQLLPGWLCEERVWVHGVFEPRQLPALVRHYGSRLAFFPNRRPESYCYALSDAWSAGLPALGPDSGAIGERIARSGAGWTYDASSNAKLVADTISDCLQEALQPPERVKLTVDQLSSSYEMAAAISPYYRHPSGVEWSPPKIGAMDLLAATQLHGAFFRAELQRLAGDLSFAQAQSLALNKALQSLGQEYELRGVWIAKIEGDLAEVQGEVSRIEALRLVERAQYSELAQQLARVQANSAESLAELGALRQRALVDLVRDRMLAFAAARWPRAAGVVKRLMGIGDPN